VGKISPDSRRPSVTRALRSILASFLCLACALLGGGTARADDANSPIGFRFAASADYGSLPWTEAFEATHAKFSREYAFSEWKGVDWPGLSARFLPRIRRAQETGDEKAYYLALLEYVCSISDGHIKLNAEDPSVPKALAAERTGGGLGMAAAELDDGRIVAAAIVPSGPAARAGIGAGAEILSWNGEPVRAAIDRVVVGSVPIKTLTKAIGGESPQATAEHHRLEQVRLLPRAPVGSSVEVTFKNPGEGSPRTMRLTAIDDGGQNLDLVNFARRPELSDRVEFRILPEGFGYVRLALELDLANMEDYPFEIYRRFREAIRSFVDAGAPGVIVDLRGNYGGSDRLAADLAGFFHAAPSFYEAQEFYDGRTGKFLRLTLDERNPDAPVDHLPIEPQEPHYGGPLVILVNPGTISSGEGLAMGLRRSPRGRVVGFHGTNSSFGMVGGLIRMPGGYRIGYPFGRSVDADGIVQLDSRNGFGGVAPDLRVPKTLDNVLAFAAGTDVELRYALAYLKGLSLRGSHQ
jgi:carboxyl-terminal processing protease